MGCLRVLWLALVSGGLCACQGALESRVLSAQDLANGYEGVPYYQTAAYRQETRQTLYVEKGRILADEEGNYPQACRAVVKAERVVSADPSRLYAMRYRPGLLEASKFSIALEGGMIKTVGTESEPDRGQTFKNLADAAASAASVAGGTAGGAPAALPPSPRLARPAPPRYLCNDGPVVTLTRLNP